MVALTQDRLNSFGQEGFRAHLRRGISLAQKFEVGVRTDGAGLFEIVAPPKWALVVFRLNPTGQDLDQATLDKLNNTFWDALQRYSSDFMLTQTILPGIGFCIRFVVGSPQTKEAHVRKTWELILECGRQVSAGFSGQDKNGITNGHANGHLNGAVH